MTRLMLGFGSRLRFWFDGAGAAGQVELLEMPFTVLTMAEVNIVNLGARGLQPAQFST